LAGASGKIATAFDIGAGWHLRRMCCQLRARLNVSRSAASSAELPLPDRLQKGVPVTKQDPLSRARAWWCRTSERVYNYHPSHPAGVAE